MLSGTAVVSALTSSGFTHVVWLPDSELGTWEHALSNEPSLTLLRVCREGEAFPLAAGLWLGGAKPIVFLQCTGLFEAGDALRNIVHDLKIPIPFVVGVRNYLALQKGTTTDTCPVYTEPILKAWQIPYVILGVATTADEFCELLQTKSHQGQACAFLLPE